MTWVEVGRLLHVVYVLGPAALLTAAFVCAALFVTARFPFLSAMDRLMVFVVFGSVAAFAVADWMTWAPIISSGLLQLVLIAPWLVSAAMAALTILTTAVLVLVRLAKRDWRSGAVLGAVVLAAAVTLMVLPFDVLPWINFNMKRPLREAVVSRMIANPALVRPVKNGSWNAGLPVGWTWLSMDGDLIWTGSGRSSQVTFLDVAGIMSGSGYVYSLDGSEPSGDPGEVDAGPIRGHWYHWTED